MNPRSSALRLARLRDPQSPLAWSRLPHVRPAIVSGPATQRSVVDDDISLASPSAFPLPDAASACSSACLLQPPFILVSPTSFHVPTALVHYLVHSISSFHAPPALPFFCPDQEIFVIFGLAVRFLSQKSSLEEVVSLAVPHSHFYALIFTYYDYSLTLVLSKSRVLYARVCRQPSR
ncbi:hypothetical protein MSAN_00480300 [Mycena sanguinolenta]|uniref:Uncharacterized protein n=1 Tax=Mycena sanguinolenta TaxID=230812 RepID=A0A8H7DHT2_9AGAR|nr:hypothetical protein MSAN_00480300 [Mycena sanguinolenta]